MNPLKILLAEDAEAQAQFLVKLLESNGHQVCWVCDGESAVKAYQEQVPDMVLVDLAMPGIGGVEAIRQMKRIPVDRWVPIIVITGSDDEGDMLTSFMAGADDYITKPINPLLLEIRLQSMMRIAEIQLKSLQMMDAVIDGVIKIDPVGRIIAYNQSAEKIFGYTPSEVMGCNVNMLMPSPYHEAHDEYLGNYMATGKAKIIGIGREVQGKRKNGEVFPMSLGVTEVTSSDHRYFVGMVRDLSVEKALQAELKNKQLFLEGLIENNDALTFVKDAEGKYLLVNRRFEQVIGYPREDVLGKKDSEIFSEDLASHFRTVDLEVLETGRVVKAEERFTKFESEYYFLSTKFPVLNPQGEPVGVCGVATDITDLKRTQHALERLSEVDELSGLSNRRHFVVLAKQELIRASRYAHQASILMIDIDHFKRINDTYGHQFGDQVITLVGNTIRAQLRSSDIAGRMGGEEFAVLLPNTNLQQAVGVAEKLRILIGKASIQTPQKKPLSCTISIGITELAGRNLDLERFLAEADCALYAAKNSGRNRVCSESGAK